MVISKRKYYYTSIIVLMVIGVFIFISAPIANKYLWKIELINAICYSALMYEIAIIVVALLTIIITNRGLKNYINRALLISKIENNLIAIGAYEKTVDKAYVRLPKIKIEKNVVRIKLSNLKVRTIIQKYLNSFSTALPKQYIVEDYYITQNSEEVVIIYENIDNYKHESYSLYEYKQIIEGTSRLELYFDKKHKVNIADYPHMIVSGASGSGKSYFCNQLIVQAIIKRWNVTIMDIKRSYGLFKDFTDYVYEIDDIMAKLKSVESEMSERMEKLQPALDSNPNILAVDIGYEPKLVVIEEFIALQSSLDKKEKEEFERIVKKISVLARQSNIYLLIVTQSAATENINATVRANMSIKVLLGNAASNILLSTFGANADIPTVNSKLNKGEGLIQTDRITLLRVPKIVNIEDSRSIFCGAEGKP